jgi:hypothetical protein
VVVAGEFRNDVDFDPGPGDDTQDPPGILCSFVSLFDSDGVYIKANSWGRDPNWVPSCEPVTGLDVDDTGNLYVTGFFSGQIDFDPGPDEEIHASNGGWDAFMSKFDVEGNHLWTSTWGGPGNDRGLGLAIADIGSIHAVGFFQDEVDFNPNDGVENHQSNGDRDAYLFKYTPSGEW